MAREGTSASPEVLDAKKDPWVIVTGPDAQEILTVLERARTTGRLFCFYNIMNVLIYY